MISIEKALRAKIVSLNTDAGSRVLNEFPEQEPETPTIIFERVGSPMMRRLLETGVPALNQATYRVSIIAISTDTAEPVAAALKAGLDGWRGTVTIPDTSPAESLDVLRCAMTYRGDSSLLDGDLFMKIIQQDYQLTYR